MNVSKLINYLTDMCWNAQLTTECFSWQEGVQEHRTDVPLVVRPLRWFFSTRFPTRGSCRCRERMGLRRLASFIPWLPICPSKSFLPRLILWPVANQILRKKKKIKKKSTMAISFSSNRLFLWEFYILNFI